jgi:hypothetical protein
MAARGYWTVLCLLSTLVLTIGLSGCGFQLNSAASAALGDGAHIRIVQADLSFGTVTVGKTVSTTVSVVNSGNKPLTISQVKVDDQSFSVSTPDNPPVQIEPNAIYTFNVGFKPTTPASYKGNLIIQSTATNNVGPIPVTGSGTNASIPQISLSANSLSFGSVGVGASAVKTLDLKNTGAATLQVDSVDLTGTGFTLGSGTFPASIEPNADLPLQVQFAPTSAGDATGQITIHSNSDQNGVAQVGLSGTGSVASSVPQLSVTPGSISFGSVDVGSNATRNLTLSSTGSGPVVVNSVSVNGGNFSISGGSFPVSLNASQQIVVQVQFAPSTTGSTSGQVIVASNSSTGDTITVPVDGSGTSAASPPVTPSPQLTVAPGAVSFGDVTSGSSVTQAVMLSSTGTSAVTVSSASVTGAGFTIVGGNFPLTLNPGQQTSVLLQFLPTAVGAATGQVVFNSDSTSGPTSAVTLSGNGVAAPTPLLSVSPGNLDFGSVTVSSPTTQSVMLTSTGTAAVTVNSVAISGTGYTIVGGSFPVTLNPNQQVTLQVQFDPTVTGAASGQLTVNSTSSSNPVSVVALSGTGAAAPTPILTVSPGNVSFGSVTVGSPTSQSVTLTSTGTSTVTVNSVGVTGPGFAVSGGGFPMPLNPNQQVTLQVQFNPTTTGAASGQVVVNSTSSSNPTSVVTLSGTGAAAPSPQLTVSPSSLAFGSVTIGSPATQNVTLTSSGTSAVTINSMSLTGTGYTVSGGSFPVTLNPNQQVTLQVQFNPTTTGAASGQIVVNSTSSSNPTSVVTLSGTGAAAPNPKLTLSPSSLSFGTVTIGSPSSLGVTLTSTGTSPMTVNSASISGAGYSVSGASLPVTLSPNQQVTLMVQFNPTTSGAASGQLTVNSTSSVSPVTVVTLSGTGAAAPSPQLTVSPASVSFGSVTIGSPATQNVTLTSSGTSAVTVNSASISGTGYTFTGGSFPVTLNPNQQVTLQVKFNPATSGTASGQLTVSSTALTNPTSTVSLSGTGAAALNPQLSISPASVSFGTVTIGSPATQNVTLTSSGTSAVTVNSASISGTGYTVTGGTFPVTLNPNQQVTLQVKFNPATAGAASGQLTVSSTALTNPTSVVSLSGTGTAALNPQLSISPASVSFGSVTIGSPATQNVTLTSSGTSAVTVNSASISGTGYTFTGGSFPVTLNPSQQVTLQVKFNPTSSGAASGQLTVSSTALTNPTSTVSLSGTGAAASNPQLTVSPLSINFGSINVNATTVQDVVLTSSGTSAVTVSGVTVAGGAAYSILGGSFPVTLSPNQQATVQVQFNPTTSGSATAQLTVSSNATGNPSIVVALSGSGTGSSPNGTPVTACGPLNKTGTYYLANDVTCTTVGFSVQANNVIFNLNGHTITYGNPSTSLSAFAMCDGWYGGDNFPIDPHECQGGSYGNFEIYGGTITEASNAAPFSHAFILGQGNGFGNKGGHIHDLTVNIGCGGGKSTCVGAQFIHGDYPGGNWRVENNVINDTVTFIEKSGQGPLGARSQYQGYAIHIDDGSNSTDPADYYANNTFNGTPQGGIADSIQKTVITYNTCHLTGFYSNDYCAILTATGTQATNNTITGRGRGFSIESSNITVTGNNVSVHEEANNSEYGGCELGGAYGIRIKDFSTTAPLTGITVSNNTVNVDSTYCQARSFDITNSFPGATTTVANNTFLTSGHKNMDFGLKLNSYNKSNFTWTSNAFGGSYCVEIGNDGDVGSGANAAIASGQTWSCGSTATVLDEDLATETSGQTYSQALTIQDVIPSPKVTCYSNSSAVITIGGGFSKTCP